MIATVSEVTLLVFGAVICGLSVWGMIAPPRLLQFVDSAMGRPQGFYGAVLARLILGVVLLITAADSRFPLAFEVLGWVAIVAAIGLAITGWKRLRAFLGWFLRCPAVFVRLWLAAGAAFGGFLIYSVS